MHTKNSLFKVVEVQESLFDKTKKCHEQATATESIIKFPRGEESEREIHLLRHR